MKRIHSKFLGQCILLVMGAAATVAALPASALGLPSPLPLRCEGDATVVLNTEDDCPFGWDCTLEITGEGSTNLDDCEGCIVTAEWKLTCTNPSPMIEDIVQTGEEEDELLCGQSNSKTVGCPMGAQSVGDIVSSCDDCPE